MHPSVKLQPSTLFYSNYLPVPMQWLSTTPILDIPRGSRGPYRAVSIRFGLN